MSKMLLRLNQLPINQYSFMVLKEMGIEPDDRTQHCLELAWEAIQEDQVGLLHSQSWHRKGLLKLLIQLSRKKSQTKAYRVMASISFKSGVWEGGTLAWRTLQELEKSGGQMLMTELVTSLEQFFCESDDYEGGWSEPAYYLIEAHNRGFSHQQSRLHGKFLDTDPEYI